MTEAFEPNEYDLSRADTYGIKITTGVHDENDKACVSWLKDGKVLVWAVFSTEELDQYIKQLQETREAMGQYVQ